jgi:hypothetical protein
MTVNPAKVARYLYSSLMYHGSPERACATAAGCISCEVTDMAIAFQVPDLP